MESNGAPRDSSRDTYLAVMICVLLGLPCFVFLNVITSGLFVLLILLTAAIGVFGAFHYFLWGRAFSQKVASEIEEEQIAAEGDDYLLDESHER